MLVQIAQRMQAAPTGGTAPVDATLVGTRPASFGDIPDMASLINRYAALGLMLPKTPAHLYRTVREFIVAESDQGVLGCGALRIYEPDLAEVCSLAVSDAARGLGVGRRLVAALHAEAARLGIGRTFALTLEPGFFHRLGYHTIERAVLPQKIDVDCAGCPKRDACDEIAVLRLAPAPTSESIQ
ncbi:MAG: N-acetyltransferase [Gemmatimonadota bacterium]